MYFIKSPLRISLGGGGTDLPAYYNKYGGQVISTTINKFVYIIINKPFEKEFILKYSNNERVKKINKIKHKIIKKVLSEKKYKSDSLEITSLADIPAGTGLGSSGAFSTALIKGLNAYFSFQDNKSDIAAYATELESQSLNEFVGMQDQYASTYGGLNFYEFNKKNIKIKKINIDFKFKNKLEKNLLMFYTGQNRKSSKILLNQNNKIKSKNKNILNNLHRIKQIAVEMKSAIKSKNFLEIGELLNEQWFLKRGTSEDISNFEIDEMYEYGIKNGAYGGKLLGAGSGGFLLFLAKDRLKLQKSMSKRKITEIPFLFENEGVKIAYKK